MLFSSQHLERADKAEQIFVEQEVKTATEIYFYRNVACSPHIYIMDKSENYWKEIDLYFEREKYFFWFGGGGFICVLELYMH